MDVLELLARKNALKDVELWLYQQYREIDKQIDAIETAQQEAEKNNA